MAANILVVDDSKTMRMTLKMHIEKLGHNCVALAENGKMGLDMFKEFNPDIVTMDVNMPDVDGITAARNILSHDKNAKIIMVTSHNDNNLKYDILGDDGIMDYLIKPIDTDRFKKIIENLGF